MMFAHAEFERRVSDLMGAITLDWSFGEEPKNLWSATSRPKRMKNFIQEHQSKHVGGIPEMDGVVACMRSAIEPCKTRNMLAHGSWWAFNLEAGVISVRAGINRPGELPHREFSEADIQQTAERFDDLEVELYKFQIAIGMRSPPRFLERM